MAWASSDCAFLDNHGNAGAVRIGDFETPLKGKQRLRNEVTRDEKVIVGLGETGLSVAKYLAAHKQKFKVIDSRENPPALQALKKLMPDVEIEVGQLNQKTILEASELVVSPGLSLKTPAIAEAAEQGVPITGDIDIFS